MEILLYLFASLVALIYVWMWAAGDREQDIEDEEDVEFEVSYSEEPTLNVQNRKDDDEPYDDEPMRGRGAP